MSTSTTNPTVEQQALDPEDDLDDLDDVLSQFNLGQVPPSPPPPPASSGRPRNNTRVDAPPHSIPGSGRNLASTDETEEDTDALSSEFAKELAQGMESLMREIAGESALPTNSASGEATTEEEKARAFKAAWEAMLVEGMDGNLGEGGLEGLGKALGKDGGTAKATGSTEGAGGFQDKIKQAMDKMKEGESKIQGSTAAPGATPTPESLEALLQSLGDLGLGEGEDETELAGFLESMMGQLMSKEVLYEPLKELADGFPGYLEKPPAPISAEDRTRYENQLACVKKILAVFEKSAYSDSNTEDNKQIVDLMGEMQSYGTPPAEIMGPLPPGLDGMGALGGEEGCTIA